MSTQSQNPQAPQPQKASLDGRPYKDAGNGMSYCQQHDVFFAKSCWNCDSPVAKAKQVANKKLADANLAAQKAAAPKPTPEAPVVPASTEGAAPPETVE